MEIRFEKRLFKATAKNEICIKTQLQVCKHIIMSEISKKLEPAIRQRRKLHDQLLQLEWKYIQLQSKHAKLCEVAEIQKMETLRRPDKQKDMSQIQKQIVMIIRNSQSTIKKIKDRQQLIVRDANYLKQLEDETKRIENSTDQIKKQGEKIRNKMGTLDFIVKEMLKNQSSKCKTYQTISEQKRNIKNKLFQHNQQLKNRLNQLQSKIGKQKVKIEAKQKQSEQIADKIYSIQADQELVLYKLTIQGRQTKKLHRNIKEEEARKFQLTQKLKVLKQKQDKLRLKSQRLSSCKQNAIAACQKLLESNMNTLEQTKTFEKSSLFNIQHCLNVLEPRRVNQIQLQIQ